MVVGDRAAKGVRAQLPKRPCSRPSYVAGAAMTHTSEEGAKAEREAIVAYLRDGAWESWDMSNDLRWWQLRLRFANRVASIAQNKVANQIERGDHLMKGKSTA